MIQACSMANGRAPAEEDSRTSRATVHCDNNQTIFVTRIVA